MIDVEEYVCEDGSCPYQTWFDNLGVDVAVTAAKAKTKMTLGAHGNIKTLNEGLFEYRIDYGPGYRIYLTFDGTRLIVLFGGGDKGNQSNDIKEARRLLSEYRARKAAKRRAMASPAKGPGRRR